MQWQRLASCKRVVGGLVLVSLALTAQPAAGDHRIDPPDGRIILSADGNLHDPDDWLATPLALAMIDAAAKKDRLVQVHHSNDLADNNKNKHERMQESVEGAIERFGFPEDIVYDDQEELSESVDKIAAEINRSSADDPLWLIEQGPMEVAWRGLNAANADKRQHVHVISHSTWNEDRQWDGSHTWEDLKADFGPDGVSFHEIQDQNKSQEKWEVDADFRSAKSHWHWLRDSDNPDWQWLYDQHNKANQYFDASDAGMTYWWLTGGPDGGIETGGSEEVEHLMKNPVP